MARIVVLLLVVLAVATPSAGVSLPPVQMFLLAGQSNMLGRAMPISSGTGATPNLLLFRNGAWIPAADPLGNPGEKSSGVGPGMTFGVGVLSHSPPGTTVGLIMCAQSSTPINDWKPGESAFNACKRQVAAAGGVVAGVVFLQGEREALIGGGDEWARGFAKVEPGFEQEFGPVPFVLGQIGTLDSGRPYQQEVRDAQAAAAAKYPEVTLVTSTDLATSDGIHFSLAAVKTLGTRYANAWYTLAQQFPSVTGVSPGVGTLGVPVTINGKGLGSATAVTFGRGGSAVFTINSPTQITATVPANAVTGPIRVSTPIATVSSTSFAVVPAISSFTPATGPPGAKIVVDGAEFKGTTAVTIGGVDAKFKILSATQLAVTVPKNAATGQITVSTAGGTAQSSAPFTVTKKS